MPPPPPRHRLRLCLGWLRAAQRTVTAHPLVFITPLLILACLLAASINGVIILSDAIRAQRQDDAANEATARGIVISEKLQMGSMPVHALANMVLSTPGHWWPSIEQRFNSTAQSIVDLLSGSGLDSRLLAVSPAGIVSAILPLEPNLSTLHLDLLADINARPASLTAIHLHDMLLIGPVMGKGGYLGAALRFPVFVNGSYGPDETFGVPLNTVAPFGNTPYNCTECYGQQRFWGFCHSIISWDVLRKFSRVDDLYNESGYLFQLTRPPQMAETTDFVLASSPGIPGDELLDDAVRVQFQVLSSTWTLILYRDGGWSPSWRTPMLVVVVVISLVVSLLIGLVMGWNCRLMETTSRLEEAAGKLQEEKERMDALLVRQYELIHCFASDKPVGVGGQDGSVVLGGKIDRLRDSLHGNVRRVSNASIRPLEGDKIDLHELLGSGNFGKVYRGTWRGTTVAVKCIVLPSSMSRSAHAESMALMETAISSSMHHPHLVQTYTYSIKPIKDSGSRMEDSDLLLMGPASLSETVTMAGAPLLASSQYGMCESSGAKEGSKDMHSFEIQLVLEFCDAGSLDEVLKCSGFLSENGLNFGGILDTAADVAKGMLHLHMNEILHSDLKAGNVMFKAGGHDGRGVIAKVVDFGLAIQLDVSGNQTHVSKMFQGTLTHMAPEVLLIGKQSKAADVYAYGILLFELYTAASPYAGIPPALLGHHVAREGRRPQFTSFTPKGYRDLAERCWQGNPDMRPSFSQILQELQAMRSDYPASRPLSLPSHSRQPFASLHASALRQCELPQRRPLEGEGGAGSPLRRPPGGEGGPASPLHPARGLSSSSSMVSAVLTVTGEGGGLAAAVGGPDCKRGSMAKVPGACPPLLPILEHHMEREAESPRSARETDRAAAAAAAAASSPLGAAAAAAAAAASSPLGAAAAAAAGAAAVSLQGRSTPDGQMPFYPLSA